MVIVPIIFNVQCDVTDIVEVYTFDRVFYDVGLVEWFCRWDGIDSVWGGKIWGDWKINIFAIVKTEVKIIQRRDYSLIVCGAVISGGKRRRTDLSLTCPVNLNKTEQRNRVNLRDEYNHLFICVAFENLQSTNSYIFLLCRCLIFDPRVWWYFVPSHQHVHSGTKHHQDSLGSKGSHRESSQEEENENELTLHVRGSGIRPHNESATWYRKRSIKRGAIWWSPVYIFTQLNKFTYLFI